MAARLGNRQAAIRRNISGGTQAPASAARGQHMGLGQRRPAAQGRSGVGRGHPAAQPSASGGTQGGAPPSQPGGGSVTPLPWDAAAANDEANALRRRNNTVTGLNAGWLRQQQAYGLEGPWADFASNPYSQAALLQRSYDQTQKGSVNSMAGAGHLYSGALVRQREGNTFQFGQQRDQLQRQYAEEFAKFTAEKQAAQDAYNEAVAQARWEAINAGLSSEPDATAAPGPGGGGGGGNVSRGQAPKGKGAGTIAPQKKQSGQKGRRR